MVLSYSLCCNKSEERGKETVHSTGLQVLHLQATSTRKYQAFELEHGQLDTKLEKCVYSASLGTITPDSKLQF